jgi:hypothetical protein
MKSSVLCDIKPRSSVKVYQHITSIFRVEKQAKQGTSLKKEASRDAPQIY